MRELKKMEKCYTVMVAFAMDAVKSNDKEAHVMGEAFEEIINAFKEISDRLDALKAQSKEQDDWIKALEKVMASYENKAYPLPKQPEYERSCDDDRPCNTAADLDAVIGGKPKQPKAQEQLWICPKYRCCFSESIDCKHRTPHIHFDECDSDTRPLCDAAQCIPYTQEQGGDDLIRHETPKNYDDLLAHYEASQASLRETMTANAEACKERDDLRARLDRATDPATLNHKIVMHDAACELLGGGDIVQRVHEMKARLAAADALNKEYQTQKEEITKERDDLERSWAKVMADRAALALENEELNRQLKSEVKP